MDAMIKVLVDAATAPDYLAQKYVMTSVEYSDMAHGASYPTMTVEWLERATGRTFSHIYHDDVQNLISRAVAVVQKQQMDWLAPVRAKLWLHKSI